MAKDKAGKDNGKATEGNKTEKSSAAASTDGAGKNEQGAGKVAEAGAGGAGAPDGTPASPSPSASGEGKADAGSAGAAGQDGKDGADAAAVNGGQARASDAGAGGEKKLKLDKELITQAALAALPGFISRTGSYGVDDAVERAIKIGVQMAEALDKLDC